MSWFSHTLSNKMVFIPSTPESQHEDDNTSAFGRGDPRAEEYASDVPDVDPVEVVLNVSFWNRRDSVVAVTSPA